MSSEFVPPLNAIELWSFTEKHRLGSHKIALALLWACGYECIGNYSDGGEYYVPIAGRTPATSAIILGHLHVQSPNSFRGIQIGRNRLDSLRKFLDAEGAYLPIGEEP